MLKQAKAFSLLELMVIVTIIAVLSTIAIPTYLNHLRKAKLGKARQYLTSLNNTIANYYTDHGTFPTNAQINITSSVPASAAQYLYKPNLAYISIAPAITTSTQCPYGISTGYFSNYNGDYYADGTSPYVVLNTYFIDNNGTLNKVCASYEYDPATGQPTRNEFFTDCIQTDDPDNSSIMNTINNACT